MDSSAFPAFCETSPKQMDCTVDKTWDWQKGIQIYYINTLYEGIITRTCYNVAIYT